MNELQEEIDKFGRWENYYQYLLNTYGEAKQQKEDFIKRTHTSEIQAYRGRQNSSEQQSLKGKQNSFEQQSIKGKKGAIKSVQVRYEGSNEQTKPWETLGISRRTYYRIIKQNKEI